jgi:hypothetical protein
LATSSDPLDGRVGLSTYRSKPRNQRMGKSFLDALVKAIAMCDPVAYMHYLDRHRQRRAALGPYSEPVETYIDQWAALSDRMGLWQRIEDAGAGVHR